MTQQAKQMTLQQLNTILPVILQWFYNDFLPPKQKIDIKINTTTN